MKSADLLHQKYVRKKLGMDAVTKAVCLNGSFYARKTEHSHLVDCPACLAIMELVKTGLSIEDAQTKHYQFKYSIQESNRG